MAPRRSYAASRPLVFGLSSPGLYGPEAILHPTGIRANIWRLSHLTSGLFRRMKLNFSGRRFLILILIIILILILIFVVEPGLGL